MCGRYAATKSTDELVEELEVAADETAQPIRSVLKNPQQPPAGQPDFNLAPTKAAPVLLLRPPRPASESGGQSGQQPAASPMRVPTLGPVRQLRLMTWGLVPSWSSTPDAGARMANARAETLLDKPSFARAARSRRCLVPATGWYEWQVSPVAREPKGKPLKQPFFIRRGDGASMTFAGLYEFWKDKQASAADPTSWLTTFTIVTTTAEPGLDRIHDRQPLVLEPDQWDSWLQPSTDAHVVAELLAFQAQGRFEAYPVGRQVGNSRSNGPGLLRPLARSELTGVIDPVTAEVIG